MSANQHGPSPQQTQPGGEEEISLYEVRKKIHPRTISGRFTTWRWLVVWLTQIVFYGLCWVPWNDRQAVLLDIAERKFYFFGLVLWPQDVFLLAILLIISAYALFLFTAIAGRLWCGYSCPQTVYTEMFLWIERLVEGDRPARIKLDAAPMNAQKFARRTLKYALWVSLSLWTGFTFVGYFTPIKTLWAELMNFSLGPWEWFWFLFYSAFTYLLAGHLREQVCKYMCPYARFQGVMFDPDTLVITYDSERGEPRGARKKEIDHRAKGLGDCVDCGICVQVCPTGIDIRNGLQYECIGCAACIDACDEVMSKMGYPLGLVRYSTENAINQHWGWREIVRHVARPRVVLYSVILGAIVTAFVWGVATKPDLRVDVIRDRATLAREVEGGMIENVYRLHVMNVTERPQSYVASVEGLPGIELLIETSPIDVGPAATRAFSVLVRVPVDAVAKGSHTIHFNVRSTTDSSLSVREKASFLMP